MCDMDNRSGGPFGAGQWVQSESMHGVFGTVAGVRPQHRTGRGWGQVEYLIRNGAVSSWVDENKVQPASLEDVVSHYTRLMRDQDERHAAELAVARGEVRYYATITPQTWHNDNAIEVDPGGPTSWECTGYALAHMDYVRSILATDDADGLDTDDVFKEDPAAPEWVREWPGPFDIRVTRERQYPTCILTGALGEDPDDCTTHGHE